MQQKQIIIVCRQTELMQWDGGKQEFCAKQMRPPKPFAES